MLNQAFDRLQSYDWGTDPGELKSIDEAVVATCGDAAARQDLETRLAAVLKTDASRAAKDFVCRKLMVIGTAASVPALAALLSQEELSHMARFALERIPDSQAAAALRTALKKTSSALQVGIISSLGTRQDAESVTALAALVDQSDQAVARAAALALGTIGTPEAAQALAGARPADAEVRLAATDASLACAEQLLASGDKVSALAMYKKFAGGDRPKHVRLAATRGMLACAGK